MKKYIDAAKEERHFTLKKWASEGCGLLSFCEVVKGGPEGSCDTRCGPCDNTRGGEVAGGRLRCVYAFYLFRHNSTPWFSVLT